ncbi:MAG: hypothetical protein HXY35_05455 [Chloroflexi bacterium]|nr:hypothetical protein [Chloroflexota bacterium]
MARVNIITKGRSGTIQYIEGSLFKKNTCEFYWEFGGADAVAIIWFPKSDAEWDAKYPWAVGRRMEIVKDMAEQVRKKQAPSSTLKWEEGTVFLISG